MHSTFAVSRGTRTVLSVVAIALIGYLAVLASWPQVREGLPTVVRWFGEPNSAPSIALVVIVLILLGAALWRAGSSRRPGAPVAIVAGLALTSAVLGMASYWRCHDDSNPTFFTPVIWTVELVKGGNPDQSLAGQACPAKTPVALDVAQLCALAAVFLTVVGAAMALFRSRVDRLRVHIARSVTAVVDLDDDAQSMVTAVARSMDHRSTLAVLVANPDRPCVLEARAQGARVVAVDFTRPQTLTSLSLWRKLDRLYLLSADPTSNLLRLATITRHLEQVGKRQRIPLIVRIDDPWQAEAWRAEHFGGTDTRWAADAVGKYEVTAHQLVDRIIETGSVRRILVCGTSRLTLALCSDLTQRQLEKDYYSAPGDPPLPQLVLLAENSEEYIEDHEHSRRRLGVRHDDGLRIEAVAQPPTVSVVSALLKDQKDASETAVVLVDADGVTGSAVDTTTGTRLAARFPTTPIYAWDRDAEVTEDRLSIVGRLRTYRLSMDMPQGQAQDAWERAARLIHDRYAAEATYRSAATVPWTDLDEFYRESNRRQVRNALWMVERIGGHTWNVWDGSAEHQITNMRGLKPLDQLRLLGFDHDAAIAMARAEHEDWRRYYQDAGWRYGKPRDNARKIHDKLVGWEAIEADPELLNTALGSLATTLIRLRELGYRSRPVSESAEWQQFRRTGTVVAQQRSDPWTWTARSGEQMQAQAGDWVVREDGGNEQWSVRDDIFRARYEHVDGDTFRSNGLVTARPALRGEVVETLEGAVTAAEGDWVVRGEHGELWPVPADQFVRRYQGPVSVGSDG